MQASKDFLVADSEVTFNMTEEEAEPKVLESLLFLVAHYWSRTVAAALEQLRLTSVWDAQYIDYTHVHTDGIATSTIDHFLISSRLVGLVEECGPVHRGDNLSRHSPIFLRLKLRGSQAVIAKIYSTASNAGMGSSP